ncbi:MAG TPA: DUF4382 domain-containing protein [Cyclobacteriaceae bacterium]|nr:DUF4382 domain-containing protein [Cyclobacteriaceae bacterium]
MRKFGLLSLVGAFMLLLASCNNDNQEGTSRIVVRLTDNPGDYEAVNVDIQDIQVKASADEGENGWTSLPGVNKGVYNLLELTNGTETVLTNSEYPSGRIGQIRLILGNENSVVINGVTQSLMTPSAQQTGLKLILNADLINGITYSLLLDFDAARSVVKLGNGGFILKPVVHVVAEAQDGAISGVMSPADVKTAIFVLSGTDTLRSAYSNASSGQFFIGGLPSGNFTVTFEPGDESGYEPKVVENVAVSVGQVKELGTITLTATEEEGE